MRHVELPSSRRHCNGLLGVAGEGKPIANSPDAWRFESILWRLKHRPEMRIADAGEPSSPTTIDPRQNAVSRRAKAPYSAGGKWRYACRGRSRCLSPTTPMSRRNFDRRRTGIEVAASARTTDNGRDCLTLLNGSNIDLAFIDVHMPELSGTEAFWSARKLGVQTFVTLMSSPPAAAAVDMAIKLRAYEFLFKPFALDDALAIIKTYARISSPPRC